MDTLSIPSGIISPQSESTRRLTPAMVRTLWNLGALVDEQRIPKRVSNAVWLEVPSARLRGDGARTDNAWLRECLERLTGIRISGVHRGGDWGAVVIAEWHIEQGGSMVRILVPPAAIEALRAPETFAKIESEALVRLPSHGQRLYSLLADRKRQRETYVQWSLDNLRNLMGVADKKAYQDWHQFRRWVLSPAVDAINDFGTVHVLMKPKKVGRSVSSVRFDWRWKDPLAATDTMVENERHSAARGREAPSPTDAPPLVEGDPVVRDGVARLVEGLGERMRISE